MKRFIDERNQVVEAKNYKEAAEKLYGQTLYHNPVVQEHLDSNLATTNVEKHKGYADVHVYRPGDKQGTFWGVEAATSEKHKIVKIKK